MKHLLQELHTPDLGNRAAGITDSLGDEKGRFLARGVTELLRFSIHEAIQGNLEALACIRVSKRPSFLEHHTRSGDFFPLKFIRSFITYFFECLLNIKHARCFRG